MAPAEDIKLVELDAATLSKPEWFFIWAAVGHKPDANLKDMMDWRQQSLGMTQAQKLLLFREGLESLMAKGFISHVRDANGAPVFDGNKQAVFQITGRIISRVTEFKPSIQRH